MADERPVLWLIAGPDAVGKTTYARRYPRACANFATHAVACDLWRILDTQLAEPRLVASGPPAAVADPALAAALPAPLREALARTPSRG